MFSGAITAIVTPMKNGEIDTAKLKELVEWQISAGINGLVPCGTTGEAATMSEAEQALVIRTVVEQTKKRVPVIAGAGANATAKAVAASKMAAEAGADALLHVTPYYNKPTQAGLVAHFRAINDATDRPIVAYNVPGRTAGDMVPDTIAEIAKLEHVVAVKEATGSLMVGQKVIAKCPEDFAVFSGDDFTCLALTLMGGKGVISVISNLFPKETAQMIAAAHAGDLETAKKIHYRLEPLMDLLFIEANPIPVKGAMAMIGRCENELRLPLLPLAGENYETVKAELGRQGLLT